MRHNTDEQPTTAKQTERNTDERIDGLYALLALLVLLAALTGYCGYRNWEEATERGDSTVPTILEHSAGRGQSLPGGRGYAPGGEAAQFPPTPLNTAGLPTEA